MAAIGDVERRQPDDVRESRDHGRGALWVLVLGHSATLHRCNPRGGAADVRGRPWARPGHGGLARAVDSADRRSPAFVPTPMFDASIVSPRAARRPSSLAGDLLRRLGGPRWFARGATEARRRLRRSELGEFARRPLYETITGRRAAPAFSSSSTRRRARAPRRVSDGSGRSLAERSATRASRASSTSDRPMPPPSSRASGARRERLPASSRGTARRPTSRCSASPMSRKPRSACGCSRRSTAWTTSRSGPGPGAQAIGDRSPPIWPPRADRVPGSSSPCCSCPRRRRGAPPLFVGGLTIVGTLVLLRFINDVVPLSIYALNLTVALGSPSRSTNRCSSSRYREELERGLDPKLAMRQTIHTAGKTVAFSPSPSPRPGGSLIVFPQQFLLLDGDLRVDHRPAGPPASR